MAMAIFIGCCFAQQIAILLSPRPHEYVLMENDIIFSENATIVLHLRIVFVSYRFQPSIRKRLKTVKTSGNLLFACQDN